MFVFLSLLTLVNHINIQVLLGIPIQMVTIIPMVFIREVLLYFIYILFNISLIYILFDN